MDGSKELDTDHALRLVIIGGDVMLPESLRLWAQSPMRNTRLLNAYGPTETTITAAIYDTTSKSNIDRSSGHSRIPIGRPMANRTAYILDNFGNPVPIGIPGELHFGGMGLSRGYHSQSVMTSEKFVPDAFYRCQNDDANLIMEGKRLYKTGDLARYLPDGNIEFLGRIDQQVKLRGFRIELGEIEHILGLHQSISEAAVIILNIDEKSLEEPGTADDKRIVGYVVPHPGNTIEVGDLNEYLSSQLPAYMIPAAIVVLEKLPLTPSGKLDRRSLPEPDLLLSADVRDYTAPRDPVEQELAVLWCEVLGIEWTEGDSPIGIFDNFFEIGGHSLLATQIISRVREKYQIDLPVRKVFETPTIAGLAQIIAESLVGTEEDEELEEMLAELEGLSDEEVRVLLEDDQAASEEVEE